MKRVRRRAGGWFRAVYPIAFLIAAGCLTGVLTGGEGDLAVVGGKICTAAGEPILDGAVLIRGGKIAAVGPRSQVDLPAGVRQVNAQGRVIIPGLVDLWAAIPGGDAPGGSPELRAAESLDPYAETWRRLLSSGITTAMVAPGVARGIGGLGAVLKLRSAEPASPEELLLKADAQLVLGLGQAPPSLGAPSLTTGDRLEQYYALRGRFTAARDYRKGWDDYWQAVENYNREYKEHLSSGAILAAGASTEENPEDRKPDESDEEKKEPEKKDGEKKETEKKDAAGKGPRPPRRPRVDPGAEVLLRAIDGKLPVLLIAHGQVDLRHAVRLRDEFRLRLAIAGATEGFRVAGDLAGAGISAAVGPVLLTGWSIDFLGHRESNAAELAAAGVPVALCGLGGSAFPSEALRIEACVASRGGLSPAAALRAITAVPAAILGLESRIGTLEAGKDGDLVILDREPTDALARVLGAVVEGRIVFEKERDA